MNPISFNGLTGEISYATTTAVLPTTKGLHIVSGGCGCGKTTNLVNIALYSGIKSILIVVPTIEAADEMVLNISRRTVKSVKALHCGENSKELMLQYRDDPSVVEDIEILVITNARLTIDPYELFIRYKDGLRDYLLIDEMINFYPPSFAIPSEISDIVTFINSNRIHGGISGTEVKLRSKVLYRHTYQSIEEMEAAYSLSDSSFFAGKTGLSKRKMTVVFNHIIANGLTPFRNRIVDIADILPVVLFDGTADIIFKSDSRLLPISGKRYRSDISFNQFRMTIHRKNGVDWNVDALDLTLSPIMDILRNTKGKTLIVTWKTIEKFPTNYNDADKFESLPRQKYDFPNIIKDKLIKCGIDETDFDVIYRGSGEDRGSNKFRDFTNIIFLGEWRIPDDIVADINNMFGCHCSFEDYKISLMVQTICRTRIRQHNGDPINVFFSDDINYNLMYSVQQYFIENSDPLCSISGVLLPCKVYKKPDKKNMVGLAALFNHDPKIRDAVTNGTPYSFQIKLDTLFALIPKDRKAKSRYSLFVKFLNDKDIDMTII